MTAFIFHSGRCLMLTKPWPKEPKSTCGGKPFCCPDERCSVLAYGEAKQDTIDTAVPFDLLKDAKEIGLLIVDKYNQQPVEDVAYDLEVDIEILERLPPIARIYKEEPKEPAPEDEKGSQEELQQELRDMFLKAYYNDLNWEKFNEEVAAKFSLKRKA